MTVIESAAFLLVSSILLALWLEGRRHVRCKRDCRRTNVYELRDLQEERFRRENDADYASSKRSEGDENS